MFYNALLLAVAVAMVNGLPNGAPLQACGNLLPLHSGIQPSVTFLPFMVNTSEIAGQGYIPNRVYLSEYQASYVHLIYFTCILSLGR